MGWDVGDPVRIALQAMSDGDLADKSGQHRRNSLPIGASKKSLAMPEVPSPFNHGNVWRTAAQADDEHPRMETEQ